MRKMNSGRDLIRYSEERDFFNPVKAAVLFTTEGIHLEIPREEVLRITNAAREMHHRDRTGNKRVAKVVEQGHKANKELKLAA